MRGRILNPFLAEIAPLDTVATAADPDGAGALTSGYDDDFKETVRVSDGTSAGVSARKEKAHLFIPCQVETEDVFDQLRMFGAGNIPDFRIALVFHFRNLEDMGLVNTSTGKALIQNNDRLVAIHECGADDSPGDLVESFDALPFLYATQPMSRSHGLSGRKRNLLLVTFEDREQNLSRA